MSGAGSLREGLLQPVSETSLHPAPGQTYTQTTDSHFGCGCTEEIASNTHTHTGVILVHTPSSVR